MNENHKAGFVSIIGKPNTGKSTLLNVLTGEKISIVTHKAQTTRHKVAGMLNTDDYQIVFNDTPGVIEPAYEMQKSMMRFVDQAIEDADIIIHMVDISERPDEFPAINQRIVDSKKPAILVINKIDLSNQPDVMAQMAAWQKLYPEDRIVPVSALKNFNSEALINLIVGLLPVHPPFFDKDQLTTKSERFIISEIIREKIFLRFHQEVPYSTEVVITEFKNTDEILYLLADVIVERESQKPIIIGKDGSGLKYTGMQSRLELEKIYGKKVFLKLFVKVKENWRNNPNMLRQFGFE
jgi:GTPase